MVEWANSTLNPPERILMGPGPSLIPPRVYRAMSAPVLGYMDPLFHGIMDDVKSLLRRAFNTSNDMCFPISGTGSAGMETAVCNSLEPGDHAIVLINGFFGTRIAEMARRVGAEVTTVEAPWGTAFDPSVVKNALNNHRQTKVVAMVHGETSTGVVQPMDEIGKMVKEHDALLILDTVTSLTGYPLDLDGWGVDFCYSGTQKCLNAPPGLSPISISPRGIDAISQRRSPVVNWYLDVSLIMNYWDQGRAYHHTPPISMIYALREALAIVEEEGLPSRFERHARNASALQAGLEALGLELFVKDPAHRLPSLTTALVPEGVNDAQLRSALLNEYNIEIGGGQGPMAGKLWRVGLMGYSSHPRNLLALLAALHDLLNRQGFRADGPGAVAVATRVLTGG